MPAIVQHAVSGEVLMHGYMNKEALRKPKPPARSPLLAHQAAAVDQG